MKSKLKYFKGYCFFCGAPMVEKGTILLPEDLEEFKEVFGEYPNRFEDTIGRQPICKDCTGDLRCMTRQKECD